MLVNVVIYLHVMSLALWFGGLFAYVAMVWPALTGESVSGFPRAMLVAIGVRTAPWIYLAMSSALVTFGAHCWLGGLDDYPLWLGGFYGLVLVALIGNNVYGSLVGWPRVMFAPEPVARRCWAAMVRRAVVAVVLGLGLLSVSVVTS